MKFFKKRAATAFMLAIAMSMSCVSPAFAEGSKDLIEVPTGSNTDTNNNGYAAYRPYIDWRNRTEFDMPCENVVHVYANAGETIYFGSNVTEADDQSIQAIVEPEINFDKEDDYAETKLNSSGQTWSGSSIAVTLPKSDGSTEAYDPTGMDFSNFKDGSELVNKTSALSNVVYLFNPTANGMGHISNLEMEQNGPNGIVPYGGSTITTDGYIPLSFEAPITGTYSFRFLSTQYILSDQPLEAEIDPDTYELAGSIDFDGLGEYGTAALADGRLTSEAQYWEEGIGYVTLPYGTTSNGGHRSFEIDTLEAPVEVPASEFSGAVTYPIGEKYAIMSNTATSGGGSIKFTPLHDNAVIEVVWKRITSDSNEKRLVYIYQDGNEDYSNNTTKGVNVTTFSNINGASIKAGKPVTIWISGNHPNVNMYEVRYYYPRTVAPYETVVPAPTASPSPIPMTAEIIFDELTAGSITETTELAYGGKIPITVVPRTDKTNSIVKFDTPVEFEETDKSFNSAIALPNCGNSGYMAIEILHDNTSLDIAWSSKAWNEQETGQLRYKINAAPTNGTGSVVGTITDTTTTQYRTDKISGLNKGDILYVWIYCGGNIYGVDYNYELPYPFEDEVFGTNNTTTASFSLYSYTSTDSSCKVDYSQISGGKTATYSVEGCFDLSVESNYTITNEYIKLAYSTDNSNPGQHVAITPKHDNSWIEVAWSSDSKYRARLYSKSGDFVSEIANKTGTALQVNEVTNLKAGETTYLYFGQNSDGGASGRIYDIIYHYPEETTYALPVSEAYTWDMHYLTGQDNNYTSNAILGDNSYVGYDGTTDRDYSYEHDLKVYATANTNESVTVKNGMLYIYNGGTFDSEGNPVHSVLELTPSYSGVVEVVYDAGKIKIEQDGKTSGPNADPASSMTSTSLDVVAGKPVYIYPSGSSCSVNIRAIHYTPYSAEYGLARKVDEPWNNDTGSLVAAWDVTVANNGVAQSGRVWTDILFLNAGGYKCSIYPMLHVLTKEGFLYDVKLNGIQPYGFVFYSNNRGLLFDSWSMYSNPALTGLSESSYDNLQSLEHSFYSYTKDSDVGDAPIRTEKDDNGNYVTFNKNVMKSTILGNYKPTDKTKDATHMMFLNTPDSVAMNAYTGYSSLRTVAAPESTSLTILDDMVYTGLGAYASENSGTIGVGGRFTVTITTDELKTFNELGATSISVTLNFSDYDLNEKGTAPVPELTTEQKWQKWSENGSQTEATDAEANNIVSLTTVIDTAAQSDKTYTLSWDGRDAYGNVVPQGEYTDGVKTFLELGTAHFPILDAEHNPNGFKLKLMNSITVSTDDTTEDTADYAYYNNEAVSPKFNGDDPSAWYFNNHQNAPANYPAMIGDGKNMSGGMSTDFDNNATQGAMVFGEYSAGYEGGKDATTEEGEAALETVYEALNKGKSGNDGGYGNYTALDIWSNYEVQAAKTFSFGVNPIEKIQPYVSFVATEGKTELDKPFSESHVGYNGQLLTTYDGSNVVDAEGDIISTGEGLSTIYGNTISTGFVAKVVAATGVTGSQVTWDITIPSSATINDETAPTYLKIPAADDEYFTTAEETAEEEYLTYELYSALFEDYAVMSEETVLGDAYVPDWEADASLDDDGEVDMVGVATGAVEAEQGVVEEMYIEAMTLASTENGYKRDNWGATFKVNADPVLQDGTGVQVNQGNIYRVESIGADTTATANIRLTYKLPSVITGEGTVKVGLIIDNLYAPGATAVAAYTNSNLESFHDITSTIFGLGAHDNAGTNTESVQAGSHEDYVMSPLNDYFTFDEGSKSSVNFSTTEFEAFANCWTVEGKNENLTYETVVDSVWPNDIFCFENVDVTDLAAIYLSAGTRLDDAEIRFYAVDASAIDTSTTDKSAVSALLTDDNLIGTVTLANTGGYTSYTTNGVNIDTDKSGTKVLLVTGTGSGYVANFDYMTFAYTK